MQVNEKHSYTIHMCMLEAVCSCLPPCYRAKPTFYSAISLKYYTENT